MVSILIEVPTPAGNIFKKYTIYIGVPYMNCKRTLFLKSVRVHTLNHYNSAFLIDDRNIQLNVEIQSDYWIYLFDMNDNPFEPR